MKKRLLTPDEIEVRQQQSDNKTYATFLLYKTARTDREHLTAMYGNKWKNEFKIIDGKLYCSISVFDDELKQWISREDVGTESNIEQDKGRASDAFKRAGFLWGIGDELYSAPNIKVGLSPDDVYNNKTCLKLRVAEIDYNTANKISKLVLVDCRNRVRYVYPQQQPQQANTGQNTQQIQPQAVQQARQPQQYSKEAIIENIKANASIEALSPNANIAMLSKFVEYYTNRINNHGWSGNFDFSVMWQKWQKRGLK